MKQTDYYLLFFLCQPYMTCAVFFVLNVETGACGNKVSFHYRLTFLNMSISERLVYLIYAFLDSHGFCIVSLFMYRFTYKLCACS